MKDTENLHYGERLRDTWGWWVWERVELEVNLTKIFKILYVDLNTSDTYFVFKADKAIKEDTL